MVRSSRQAFLEGPGLGGYYASADDTGAEKRLQIGEFAGGLVCRQLQRHSRGKGESVLTAVLTGQSSIVFSGLFAVFIRESMAIGY